MATVGVAGFWYLVLRGSTLAPVSLETAAATAAAANGTSAAGSSNPVGTWTISSGSGSFAGYRVNENLAGGIGSHTAVGRTTGVQGSLVYDGKAISSVHVDVDMTGLKSEQSQRDDTLKMQAIQTCQYPTSSFDLSTPITIDGSPADGTSLSKTVQGNLTLHGVTKAVSIDLKGQLKNGQLVVVGTTSIVFADYGIKQPQSFFVVSLDDHGIMEFQLIFSKTSASTTAPAAAPVVTVTPAAGCSGGSPGGAGGPGGGGGFPPPGGGNPGGGGGGGVPTLPTFGPTPPPVVP